MTIDWNFLTPVIISSAVVSASISALAGIITVWINNNNTKKLEQLKRNNEWNYYRYTKLYELLEKLEQFHGFSITVYDDSQTFNDALERRAEFIALYKLSKSLIINKHRVKVDAIINQELPIYCELIKNIQKQKQKSPIDARQWSNSISNLPDALSEAINNQLSEILEFTNN